VSSYTKAVLVAGNQLVSIVYNSVEVNVGENITMPTIPYICVANICIAL